MEIKLEVKMTPKLMYDFMMYHTYHTMSGIFGVLMGILAFVIFGVTLGKTDVTYSIVYAVFGMWFLFYLPVSLYTKSKKQVKKNPVFQKPITYILNAEGIQILQGEEKAMCNWNQIVKVSATKKSLLIYSGKRNAFLLPKEAIGEQEKELTALIKNNMPKKKVKL